MICEPSSSSSRPSTEFILNGSIESIIAKVNPSDLHYNLEDGIQIKEDLIANVTHASLYENLDYEKSEEIIARTLGDKYTEFLLGTMNIDDLANPIIPPNIRYIENDKMINTKMCGLTMDPIIDEGSIPVNKFTFYWSIVIAPKYGIVTYSNRSIIDPHISFSKPGSYTIRMIYKYNRLTLLTSTVFNVLQMNKSQ